jgi:hypothetical protein
MRRGGGIKDPDDKSRGMEILITEDFAKIKPNDPLILSKQHTKKTKVTGFLRYVVNESRCITVSIQEQKTKKVIIKTSMTNGRYEDSQSEEEEIVCEISTLLIHLF